MKTILLAAFMGIAGYFAARSPQPHQTASKYSIIKSKEDGVNYAYSITLPNGTGYDFCTPQEIDTLLFQGKPLSN